MNGRFGLFGLLFIVLFALIAGGIGYAIGTSASTVAVVPAGGVVYPVGYAHWGWGWGFPFLGILFFFLFIGLIFAALRPRRWSGGPGWGGRGGWYGPRYGGWGPGSGPVDPNDPRVKDWLNSVPPPVQATFEAWHRQQHDTRTGTGSEPATGSAAGGAGSAGSTGSTGAAGSSGATGPTNTSTF